jgi:hypothetical protein
VSAFNTVFNIKHTEKLLMELGCEENIYEDSEFGMVR